MKKNLKIILILILILTGCSNESSKTHINIYVPYIKVTKQYDDSGNVIRIWEDELTYNESGAIKLANCKFSENDGSDTCSYDYNIEPVVDSNKKLKTASYIKKCEGNSWIQKENSKTVFNDDGTIKCTESKLFERDTDKVYIDITTYEYTQMKKIPRLKKYTYLDKNPNVGNSKYIYKYDYQNDVPISCSCFKKTDSKDLELYCMYNYEYDEYGYKTKLEYIYYEDDTYINGKKNYLYYENIYDKNNRLIKIFETGQNDYSEDVDRYYEFTYDNNDNIIKVQQYNKGNIEYSDEYVYKAIQIKKEYKDYAYIVNSIPDYTWRIAKFDKIGIGYELGRGYARW